MNRVLTRGRSTILPLGRRSHIPRYALVQARALKILHNIDCVNQKSYLLKFLSATKQIYYHPCPSPRPSVRPSGLVGGYLSRSLSVHRSLVANVVTCRTGATSDSVKMRRFNLKHQEKQEKYFVRQLFSDSKFGSSVHFK